MAYGTIKVDTITFTDSGVDKSVSISGLVQNPTFSGNITVTGTVSGNTIQGQTVSGVTVTGTTASFTSGNFTTFTGGTITLTSGVIASGTAANPSLSILGDANTGLYSPGADQLAISTGGSGRLFVDASGNVGVGITPANNFHVSGGALTRILVSSTSAGARTDIAFRNSASVVTSVIGFDGTNNEYDYRSGDLVFRYVGTETARLTSTGRLGVGTSAPARQLSITTATNDDGIVLTNSSANGGRLRLESTGTGGRAYHIVSTADGSGAGGGKLVIFDNTASDAVRLAIDSSGRIGIGTSAPVTNLHIVDAAGGRIRVGGGVNAGIEFNGSDTRIDIPAANTLATYTNSTERARIDSSGRLLVGTSTARNFNNGITTPRLQLEGLDVAQSTFGLARNSANTGGPVIAYGKSRGTVIGSMTAVIAGDDLGRIQFQGADGTQLQQAAEISAHVDGTPGANDMPGRLVFSTTADGASSPTERVRIDSSGRLLVGTSSARSNFYNGANTAQIQLEGTNFQNAAFAIVCNANSDDKGSLILAKNRGTTVGSNTIVQNGDDLGSIEFQGSDGAEFVQAASVKAEVDGTPGANDMPGRLVFSTTADGASSPTERLRITSAGLVGVGTSSPVFNFVVAGSGSDGAWFNSSGTVGRMGLGAIANGAGGAFQISYDRATGSANFGVGTRDTPSTAFAIDSNGRLGIGTTSPLGFLHIETPATTAGWQLRLDSVGLANESGFYRDASDNYEMVLRNGLGGLTYLKNNGNATDANLAFFPNGVERARFDSSGRLLFGTSSDTSGGNGNALLQVVSSGPGRILPGRSDGNTTADQAIGAVDFRSFAGSVWESVATITALSDGVSGSGDKPGRLVFSTTADGASSPTERMRITQTGYLKASDTGLYHDSSSSGTFHEFRTSISSAALVATASNASYTGNMYHGSSTRASSTVFSLLKLETNTFSDVEFNLRGDGNAFADGSWSGGGADYAEYFEWSDSNPDNEDRRGISVVLDGDKICEAVAGEDPIGVISGNPSVVGDAAWNKWSGKYLRDEFGTYIQEDYEVEGENGNTVIQQRRKLNPAYDPEVEYVSREQRPEWDCVGLMGKLRIRKGQVTGSRWIKMRDINDSVEEWLVR